MKPLGLQEQILKSLIPEALHFRQEKVFLKQLTGQSDSTADTWSPAARSTSLFCFDFVFVIYCVKD